MSYWDDLIAGLQTPANVPPPPDAAEGLAAPYDPNATTLTPDQTARAPHNIFTKTLDLFQRLSYGSAKFQDTLAAQGMDAFGKALNDGWQEIANPTERLTYDDLLDRYVPEFGQNHPILKGVTAFVGQNATDPLMWLTAGTAGGPEAIASTGEKIVMNTAAQAARGAKMAEIAADPDLVASLVSKLSPTEKAFRPVAAQADYAIGKSAAQWVADQAVAGANFVDKGGLKVLGKTIPYTPEILSWVGKTTGLSQVADWFSSLRGVNYAKWAQKVGLSEEEAKQYVGMVSRFQNYADTLKGTAQAKVASLLEEAGITKEPDVKASLERIQQMMYDIHDTASAQINSMGDVAAAEGQVPLPGMGADNIASDVWKQKIDEWTKLHGLTKAETDAAMALKGLYHGTRELTAASGIIHNMLYNFKPSFFSETPEEVLKLSQWSRAGFPTEWLPAAEQEAAKSFQAAQAAGMKPLMDAAQVAALHVYDADRLTTMKQFNDGIKTLFNVNSFDELPLGIQRDIRFIGDGRFSIFGADKSAIARKALIAFDSMTSKWKKMATVAKPYFAPRQFIQNMFQGYLDQGPKIFRSLDPRDMGFTFHMLMDGQSGFSAQDLKFVDDFGRERNASDLIAQMPYLGVKKGVTPFSETKIEQDATKLLQQNAGSNPIMRGIKQYLIDNHGQEKGDQYFKQLLTANGAFKKFTNWGGWVEDFNRTAMWLTGIKRGLTPEESIAQVNRALFDYSHGLSQFQSQIMKRFVPFFTFEKFAGELVAKTAVQNPGRIAMVNRMVSGMASTVAKIGAGVDNMLGGKPFDPKDKLTASDINSIPGYAWDEPFALKNFDDETKAHFLRFSNFNPLDILSATEEDDKGGIDLAKTAKKVFASQLTPFLKYPLEEMLGKNLFTDQAIADPNQPGRKLGAVQAKTLLTNIASSVLGSTRNSAYTALLAKAVGEPLVQYGTPVPGVGATGILTQASLENIAKKVLGWQEIQDPETGKTNVYINPYLAHTMTSLFPFLGQAINISKEDLSPQERAMGYFTGAAPVVLDLKKEALGKFKKLSDQARQITMEANNLQRIGATDAAEEKRKTLQDLQEEIRQTYAAINLGDVHGQ